MTTYLVSGSGGSGGEGQSLGGEGAHLSQALRGQTKVSSDGKGDRRRASRMTVSDTRQAVSEHVGTCLSGLNVG